MKDCSSEFCPPQTGSAGAWPSFPYFKEDDQAPRDALALGARDWSNE